MVVSSAVADGMHVRDCLVAQRLALQLKAVMENVTNLQPDSGEFRWYLKVCVLLHKIVLTFIHVSVWRDRFIYTCMSVTL